VRPPSSAMQICTAYTMMVRSCQVQVCICMLTSVHEDDWERERNAPRPQTTTPVDASTSPEQPGQLM
jgi:hypothetical protein